MDDAKELWSWWQSLLAPFRYEFTCGGWVRFVQWVTGTVLCAEEHTITQILTALGLESQWRNVEHFAEYGAWDRQAVERQLMRLVEREHPARWGGYHPVAVDDTKEHRTSADVWGTCTFHESTARCPNRATTVRAHNWVVLGDLVPGKPWTYLPLAARLYFRKSQLPFGETFCTKTAAAVGMLRQADAESQAPILAAFDGAYAMETVVRPCLNPPPSQRRIEFITRLRKDARLYEPLTKVAKNPKGGRPRKWGRRLPAPQEHAKWNVKWQRGRAYLYGRVRTFRYKRQRCCWSVSGPSEIMNAYVFEVPGYKKLFYDHQRRGPVGQSSARGGRWPLPPGRWISRSQTTPGNGGMSSLDQGADPTHLPGADGGADAAAIAAVPTAGRLWRELVPAATLESHQASCVDLGPASSVLETSPEVFATPGCAGRLAKTSANQIPLGQTNCTSCVKS